MKKNLAKQKLRDGQPTFGTWLSLGDLYATRVMARLGFDWLTLDMEHSPIDWSQAATIFAAVSSPDRSIIPYPWDDGKSRITAGSPSAPEFRTG